MPLSGPPRQDAERTHVPAITVLRALALAAILLLPVAVIAGWLDMLAGTTQKAGSRAAARGGLQAAVRHVKSLPDGTSVALAAEATQEGHWRFVNKAGETFTAGTPGEMKRVVGVLHPDAKAGARLSVYVTDDTILSHRAALKALPPGAEMFVVTGGEGYRVLQHGARVFAELRSNLVIEIANRRLFREAAWQLERPLDRARVRVLALEPGGPSTLSAWPRLDKATKRALIDVIDPASLPAAMGSVRGQTLLITGRVDGDLLYVQPSSGPERSMLLKDLFKAAAQADANLIILHAPSTPRQPGGRNWLWLTVGVKGLEEAMQRARMADFLNALGPPNRRLAAVALPVGGRALLDLTSAGDLPGTGSTRRVSDLLSGMVSDLVGNVVTTAVQANLRSAERQQELDRRLVPGIPSSLQVVYVALMIFGLFGVPRSRMWWQRVWPPEVAAEYAGRTGYWAARAVRGSAYACVFMPLVGIVAAPYNLFGQIADSIMTPVRWWQRRRGRTNAGADSGTAPQEAGAAIDGRPGKTSDDMVRAWEALEAARRLGSTRPSR